MSGIDDELEKAVLESEEKKAPANPPAHAASVDEDEPRRGIGLLIGLLAIGGGILTLVLNSGESVVYAYDVDKLAADAENIGTRQVKVTGNLVSGTLVHRTTPCEYRFRMEKNGAEMGVRYPQCIIPDTFKDVAGQTVEVTAEGRLGEDGQLDASHIYAKCPSKYEGEGAAPSGKVDHKGLGPKPAFIAPREEGIR